MCTFLSSIKSSAAVSQRRRSGKGAGCVTLQRLRVDTRTFFYQYVQSFSPQENLTPGEAHRIAQELAERFFPGCEVLVATHIDAEHLHSHLIVNSVHPDTGKKLHFSPNTLEQMRKVSDQICMEHGLTTLKPYQQPLATADLLARWLNQTKDLHQGMCQDLEKVQRGIQEENRQAGKQRDEFMRHLSTVIERLRRDGEELQKSFRRWAATTIMCSVAGATVASILVWGIECFHGS